MRSLRGTDGESQTEEELNRRWNKSWTRNRCWRKRSRNRELKVRVEEEKLKDEN